MLLPADENDERDQLRKFYVLMCVYVQGVQKEWERIGG